MDEDTDSDWLNTAANFPVLVALATHSEQATALGVIARRLLRAGRSLQVHRVAGEWLLTRHRFSRADVQHLLLSAFYPPTDMVWQEISVGGHGYGALCVKRSQDVVAVHHVDLQRGALRGQSLYAVRNSDGFDIDVALHLRSHVEQGPGDRTKPGILRRKRWIWAHIEARSYDGTAMDKQFDPSESPEIKQCLADLCLMSLVQAGCVSVEAAAQVVLPARRLLRIKIDGDVV